MNSDDMQRTRTSRRWLSAGVAATGMGIALIATPGLAMADTGTQSSTKSTHSASSSADRSDDRTTASDGVSAGEGSGIAKPESTVRTKTIRGTLRDSQSPVNRAAQRPSGDPAPEAPVDNPAPDAPAEDPTKDEAPQVSERIDYIEIVETETDYEIVIEDQITIVTPDASHPGPITVGGTPEPEVVLRDETPDYVYRDMERYEQERNNLNLVGVFDNDYAGYLAPWFAPWTW